MILIPNLSGFPNRINFGLIFLLITFLLNSNISFSQAHVQINPLKVFRADNPPEIDGNLTDSIWLKGTLIPLKYWAGGVTNNNPLSVDDLSANFGTVWNEQGLFIQIIIKDDIAIIQNKEQRINAYKYDCIEVYLNTDWDNLRTENGEYLEGRCSQIRINRGHSRSYAGENDEVFRNTIFKQKELDDGWIAEIYIPWSYFDFSVDELQKSEKTIGFEISVSDADDELKLRDAILMWNNDIEDDQQWQNINYFGQIILSNDSQ